MGKIGRFISKVADAVKELVSDEPVIPMMPNYVAEYGQVHQVYPPTTTPPVLSTSRSFLPMKSLDKEHNALRIVPGKSFAVTARPQVCAFRVEEIEIIGNPDAWTIEDIKVGHRSQLVQSGDLPGAVFGPGVSNGLRLDTCQAGMDFAILAKYIGQNPEGEVFEAKVIGTSAN